MVLRAVAGPDPGAMPEPQDLATSIDRWGLLPRLVDMQRQRLILGLVGAMASVGFNLWHPAVESSIPVIPVAVLAGLYLVVGAGLLVVRRQAARRVLIRQAKETAPVALRDRALALAAVINRTGNAWLAWAAAGHMVIAVGAPTRLGLAAGLPGTLLWLLALPTVGLLVHGLATMPTRERLLALDARYR